MLISIHTHEGKLREILDAQSHAAAIKRVFKNPMKKATARDFDFVVDSIETGQIERTYWIFK